MVFIQGNLHGLIGDIIAHSSVNLGGNCNFELLIQDAINKLNYVDDVCPTKSLHARNN